MWGIIFSPILHLVCEYGVHQHEAHMLRCPEVGDGKGRTLEVAEDDEEWCEQGGTGRCE